MGQKNTKNKTLKFYHNYIDEQSQQSYQKRQEISSKLLSFRLSQPKISSQAEKCMSFCIDTTEIKEVSFYSSENNY